MRSGLFVAPEPHDWLLLFSFPPSLPCLCPIMRDCVGEFTVCCNLIQNKVAQQNTESERCSSSSSEAEAEIQNDSALFVFFFSFSVCSQAGWRIIVDGYRCVILKLCYAAYSLQRERPSDKIHPCDPYTSAPLPITEAQRFKLGKSVDPFPLLLTHICRYSNTHTWIISGAW